MITVKLYGLVRLETGIKQLQIEAGNIRELKKALTKSTVFLMNLLQLLKMSLKMLKTPFLCLKKTPVLVGSLKWNI